MNEYPIPRTTPLRPLYIAAFADHVLVKYAGKYYDPSYGTGPFDSVVRWEDDSVDGYGVQFLKEPDQYAADFGYWIGKQDTKGEQEVVEPLEE